MGTMGQEASGQPHNILVVDDEALIRLELCERLTESGFRVLETYSADKAVELLADGGAAIDLVLTDVRMPGRMDGLALADWMRQNQPGIPVILCSGAVQKDEAVRHLSGDVSFFEKPYDSTALIAHIRQILAVRATGR